MHNIKEWERGGGGKEVYDFGKFEMVDFINFVQSKGNCFLLRSEHYLERYMGRTQHFCINSYTGSKQIPPSPIRQLMSFVNFQMITFQTV